MWSTMNKALPSKHQHGFRPHHSTSTAIATAISKISKSLEQKLKVAMIALDMSAAFDLLDQKVLIPILFKYRFPNTLINIYKDFLTDRKAVVTVDMMAFSLLFQNNKNQILHFYINMKRGKTGFGFITKFQF